MASDQPTNFADPAPAGRQVRPRVTAKKPEVNAPAPDRTSMLVLGMHRSGTSALTRVLSLLGCDLPKSPLQATESNTSGHWESKEVIRFNDTLLASAGTSWDDWLEFNPRWSRSPKAKEFQRRAQDILAEEFEGSSCFVLKDPRICRFPRFWITALHTLGTRPVVLLPIRNPLEVAASLEARNGFPPAFGQLLWLRHVLDAEHGSRGVPRWFTSYDQMLTSAAGGLIGAAEEALGLSWPALSENRGAEIDEFLDRRHRHHSLPSERLTKNPTISRWLRQSYAIFSRWAEGAEDEGDVAALDEIRGEFNRAGPAFARLAGPKQVAEQRRLNDERARLERDGERKDRALSETRASLATRTEEKKQFEERLREELQTHHETRVRVEAVRAERRALEERLRASRTEAAQRQAELDEALRTVEHLRSRLDEESRHRAEALGSVKHLLGRLDEESRQSQRLRSLAEREIRSLAARQIGRAVTALAIKGRWPLRRWLLRRHADRLRRVGLVDAEWYLERNPDVAEAGTDPVLHYLLNGAEEGRAPNRALEDPLGK